MEKARELKKKKKTIYFCFMEHAQVFDCLGHNRQCKILKEMGIPDHITIFWETCMQVKKQQLEPDIEQTSSKMGKEYIKAVYCHVAYLTYMQGTSWEMLGWMNPKLESRLWEKYQ